MSAHSFQPGTAPGTEPRPADPSAGDGFAAKFRLVLEALNWSRARCAHELGVHKSVVSRWASGLQVPTEHNLTRFTALIRDSRPDFSLGTWRLDMEAFARRLGMDSLAEAPAPTTAAIAAAAVPVSPPAPAAAEPKPVTRPSIAVLAFDNLSRHLDDEIFGDGIAEDITTELAREPWLLVIARSSSFTFKGRTVDIREIGQALGARYVLEGSVRRGADRIRVSAQLIEAATRTHLWAERYDRPMAGLFELQDEITSAVTRATVPAVEDAERRRAMLRPPNNLDAWEAYQRGNSLFLAVDVQGAIEAFRRAITLDPGFGRPHARLSYIYFHMGASGVVPYTDAAATALTEAHTAIELAPGDPLGQSSLAIAYSMSDRHGLGLPHARSAVELGPSHAPGFSALGIALTGLRRFGEAKVAFEEGMRITPIGVDSRPMRAFLAGIDLVEGNYRNAAESMIEQIPAQPRYAHYYVILLSALGHMGQQERAAPYLARWIELAPAYQGVLASMGIAFVAPEDSAHIIAGIRLAGWRG
jgi:adenylate cyclase